MANKRSMTRKLKKCSASDNGDSSSWSNLNADLLLLIMMQVGVVDFIAFSGVCKSWRSFALSNWNKFMASKQPMYLSVVTRINRKVCYLEDNTRRKLKTLIPHASGRICVGITSGYLIFFGKKTRDFWLVNPLTRKELHFPGFPHVAYVHPAQVMGILVFSPSMSGWVFVVVPSKYYFGITFSLAGEQARWRYIFSNRITDDLHFFKGKIYMMNANSNLWEVKLFPEPVLTLVKMNNSHWLPFAYLEFVSSSENLYLVDKSRDVFEAMEVDLDEMKWVKAEKTIGEYALFLSEMKCHAAIKPDTWAHPWTRYEGVNYSHGGDQSKKNGSCSTISLWYFPHDCLIDNKSDMVNGALLNILEE